MKNLILVAALGVALAGCDQAAEEADEPEAAATEAAATATPASFAGTYEVTLKDGSKFTSVLNADGTYQDTAADGTVSEKGTWQDKDGKACFDSEGGDDKVVCFATGEVAADGTQVATPDDGTDPLTIKKTN